MAILIIFNFLCYNTFMKIITTIKELQIAIKKESKSIGFVPTMGALHEGHLSLIKQSRKENKTVVVSIFVNPTQFLKGEDLSSYPSKNEADIKICELAGVDILFMPNINTMYSNEEINISAPLNRGFILEGFSRPGHFDGVLQIVLKLFNLVQPTNAYFGKKDAQQLALIKQMVKNLFLPINIVECEIIRDENGLALSSRNVYLSKTEKVVALNISKSLKEATRLILEGQKSIDLIISHMKEILKDTDIEYVQIVSRDFKYLNTYEAQNSIILVATKVGKTRLIDNLWI